jgi:hypothetical protein
VVLTFLVAAVLSYLSADGVRAVYLLAVGVALAWDRARHRVPGPPPAATSGAEIPRQPALFSAESAERHRAAVRRLLVPAAAAAVGYSLLLGLFQRYSWPATVLACVPAAAGVIVA